MVATDSNALTVPPSLTPAKAPQANIVDLFVQDEDDALGTLALALLVKDNLRRRGSEQLIHVFPELHNIDRATVSTIYYPAAKRILDIYVEARVDKELDKAAVQERAYTLLSQDIELKHELLNDTLEATVKDVHKTIAKLENSQSFGRQLLTTAGAGILVVVCTLALAFAPDLNSVIKKLLRL